MRGSKFIFDNVDSLYYKLHKISLNRSGSYKGSPKWLENRNATINPINEKDDKCFQYASTVALNSEKFPLNSEVIQKEYQILVLLLINIIGKKQISHQIKKTRMSLKKK